MPSEIVVYIDPDRAPNEFYRSFGHSDVGELYFRFKDYGVWGNLDVTGDTIRFTARNAFGDDLPAILALPATPGAAWAEGLVVIPFGSANLTNSVGTKQVVLERNGQVVAKGYVEVIDKPGAAQTPLTPTGGNTEGTTGNRFEFCQDPAAAQWIIAHNLGGYPNVVIIDDSGNDVEGDLTYVDENNITIDFLIPVAGCAYLN